MGYYAHSDQSDFLILRDKFGDILETMHGKWPEYTKEDDILDVIADFGLTAEVDNSGNIANIYHEDNKFYEDVLKSLFDVLAPFVEAGSYITFRGEDDSIWAYYFDGSECKEYQGQTIFPGMSMAGPAKRRQMKNEEKAQ